ncbi:hypothetical protein ACFQ08_20785 [Streptosporangium algeriense]|uniref:Uncharacterized protein n=1 Tax=Streptosporangium algeriense TaxID=1682748 RepID=A0ABW3DT15_9ACTN
MPVRKLVVTTVVTAATLFHAVTAACAGSLPPVPAMADTPWD